MPPAPALHRTSRGRRDRGSKRDCSDYSRESCADIAQIFSPCISGHQSTRRLLEVGDSDHDSSTLIDALRRIDAVAPFDGQPTDGVPTLGETLLGLVGAGVAARSIDKAVKPWSLSSFTLV